MHRFLISALLLGLFSATKLQAQDAVRYELGKRLASMERAWEGAEPAKKAQALPHLQAAVKRFFGLHFSEAAGDLDAARLALLDLGPESPQAWALQFALEPAWRLGAIHPEQAKLLFRLRTLYDSPAPKPKGRVEAIATLRRPAGQVLAKSQGQSLAGTSPLHGEISLEGVPEGDHELCVEFSLAGRRIGQVAVGVSLAKGLGRRIESLTNAAEHEDTSIEACTTRRLVRDLIKLRSGETLEIDAPASRWLAEAEDIKKIDDPQTFYDLGQAGEFWLDVALSTGTQSLRLMSPPSAGNAPRPLVIALHGAGGSENMFFEGYGYGAAVRLAKQRGWVLLAPRAPFFGSVDVQGLLHALAQRYRIDPARVFLLGHSMGAAQVLAIARKHPAAYRALAILGGGIAARSDHKLVEVPVYIAAGTLDFGRAGSIALHKSLVKLGGKVRLDLREGIEHLTIVQESLPAAFGFFDEALKKR